jgi:hypothetical protein
VEALADTNAAARERSTERLVAEGRAARRALGGAARSDDPEVRLRARAILRRIPWDSAEDPPEVRNLLANYGTLEADARRQVVRQLASVQGDARRGAWRALGRLLLEDPDDNVLWEIVGLVRTRPQDDAPLGLGPIRSERLPGPMFAMAGRVYLKRRPELAAQLLVTAIERDAANPATDRTEVLAVVQDVLNLARPLKKHGPAAQLLRNQYPLTPAGPQRQWLVRELYCLHAEAGPLKGFGVDLVRFPPDLSDPLTLYALANLDRRLGGGPRAISLEWAAYLAVGLRGRLQHDVPARRMEAANFLFDHGWVPACERELNEVLRVSGEQDLLHRANAHLKFIEIEAGRGDHFKRAERIRVVLELIDKEPDKVHLAFNSTRMTPDDRDSMRATMHWLYFIDARSRSDESAMRRHADELVRLRPANENVFYDVLPLLKRWGRDEDAQALFERNYENLKAQLKDVGMEPAGLDRLAKLCAVTGQRLEEARQYARLALSQEPENAGFISTLAEVEYASGNAAEAVRLQSRAVELKPGDKQLADTLHRFGGAGRAGRGPTTATGPAAGSTRPSK